MHNFLPILTFFTNLESSGDGQHGADTLINFSADYDLETAVWKKWPGLHKVPLFLDFSKLKRKMTTIALMANRLNFHLALKNRKSAQKCAPGGIFCIIILTRLVHVRVNILAVTGRV